MKKNNEHRVQPTRARDMSSSALRAVTGGDVTTPLENDPGVVRSGNSGGPLT
jgi:hypothetical protein